MTDLAEITLSECETHHLKNGVPLYNQRFNKVLKFHAPGFAPVKDKAEAYHIGLNGQPVYKHRYDEVFGYYEGFAAVREAGAWFHVDECGEPVYKDRYEWCGNFQNGSCVVKSNHGYAHINHKGGLLYQHYYAYAGDFRDDIAVIQDFNGRYTHIKKTGKSLHQQFYQDLDVYHKSYARAKDSEGYCHIDLKGCPIYAQRYAMIEPFYNGIARVETFFGELLRINEQGHVLESLRAPTISAFQQLSSDLVGFWRSQTIKAAVSLGVFEQLPATSSDLTDHMQLPLTSTKRLLRALAELGLVRQEQDIFHLTEKSVYLTKAHPLSLQSAAKHWADENYQAWTALTNALHSGQEVYSEKFGMPIFDWLSRNPDHLQDYQAALNSYAKHDYHVFADKLDLSAYQTIIDAAGGKGVLLQSILESHPHLAGELLEMDAVVNELSFPVILGSRASARSFDLFKPWPSQADVVFLARVLHDWNDEQCVVILKHATQAIKKGGELCVIEFDFPENSYSGGLLDLNMLLVTGGQERSLSEYKALAKQAGLSFMGKIDSQYYHLLRFKMEA